MLRLCLVDDDALLLAGMRRSLRRVSPPIELTTAESGAEALTVLERQPIDVVMSDLSMPGMDGEALLTQVQRHYPHVTRVLSTGALDATRAFDMQVVSHRVIAKPMNTERLMILMQQLEEWHGQRELSPHAWGGEPLPFHVAAAVRLREQRPRAITADIARQNPWLAMLLLQATHAGYVDADAPMDVRSAVQAIGPVRLEIMRERLQHLGQDDGDDVRGVAARVASPSLVTFVELAQDIAAVLVNSPASHDPDDSSSSGTQANANFVAVAESAALLRAMSLSASPLVDGDHTFALQVALEAARHGVPRPIVKAVRESVSHTADDAVSPALAVRWAAALLHDPDVLHLTPMDQRILDSVSTTARDRWRARACTTLDTLPSPA